MRLARKTRLFTLLTFLTIILALLLSFSASAAEFKTGEEVASTASIVNDNLYITGGRIDVGNTINGNLVAAGGQVTTTGQVNGDATLAAGDISAAGYIRDDLRVAGGNIMISCITDGDVSAAGGRIVVSPEAVIGKSLVIYGGDVSIEGNVKGDLIVRAGRLVINSVVEGDADIVSDELAFKEDAFIKGSLTYSGRSAGSIDHKMVGGGIILKPSQTRVMPMMLGLGGLSRVNSAILMIVVGIILLIIMRRFCLDAAKAVLNRFAMSIAYGLLGIIGIPILAVFLIITIIGIPAALLLLLLYLVLLYVSNIIASLILGQIILKAYLRVDTSPFISLVIGVVALSLIRIVPIIGGIVGFIALLAGIGGIITAASRSSGSGSRA
ncbi:hypothetical protein COT48_00070 [Candidatus Woesearchaeota archaeon CG08_land_8_20_14_0_20_47_9]|nr:MAG: hypothetical protein COT48_00070 [Candidatus Woesearchaeota archaeon CG08_land_8_20_14_0_20_47_9]